MRCDDQNPSTLPQIAERMRELEELFLVPMETEDEALALLLEYFELDNEWDRRMRDTE